MSNVSHGGAQNDIGDARYLPGSSLCVLESGKCVRSSVYAGAEAIYRRGIMLALSRCDGRAEKCGLYSRLHINETITTSITYSYSLSNIALSGRRKRGAEGQIARKSFQCEQLCFWGVLPESRGYARAPTPLREQIANNACFQSWLQIGSKTRVILPHFRLFVRVRLAESTGLSCSLSGS